jgi:hypothetical protein
MQNNTHHDGSFARRREGQVPTVQLRRSHQTSGKDSKRRERGAVTASKLADADATLGEREERRRRGVGELHPIKSGLP